MKLVQDAFQLNLFLRGIFFSFWCLFTVSSSVDSVTKECLVASIIFLLERLGYIAVPHPLIYFGVVIFFVYFKISSLLLGIVDPFVPLENLFCAIFMGGMWDAMRRAVKTEPVKEEDKDGLLRNDVIKSKEEKKKE